MATVSATPTSARTLNPTLTPTLALILTLTVTFTRTRSTEQTRTLLRHVENRTFGGLDSTVAGSTPN